MDGNQKVAPNLPLILHETKFTTTQWEPKAETCLAHCRHPSADSWGFVQGRHFVFSRKHWRPEPCQISRVFPEIPFIQTDGQLWPNTLENVTGNLFSSLCSKPSKKKPYSKVMPGCLNPLATLPLLCRAQCNPLSGLQITKVESR